MKKMNNLHLLLLLSVRTTALTGSHSLGLIIAYIKGETPFSEFSFTVLLDDITVGHFDSEKKMYFSRGLSDVEEDDGVVDPNQARSMSSLMHSDLEERWLYVKHVLNQTELKPRVRIIQRRRSVSGWDGVTCLGTGFYPRHINLTILRDGQPVPDHLITGGELLPNGDGTYQMRKNLEFSEKDLKKHNYTCTVTHLSLDNKLNVLLDLGPGDPIVPIVGSVLAALLLVCVMSAVIWVIYRKKMKASTQSEYSSAPTAEKSETSVNINGK